MDVTPERTLELAREPRRACESMIGREQLILALAAAPFVLAALASAAADTPIRLRDDVGRSVHAARPASRVVTLAPFLTEYVVTAGAADLLVGIADGSDQPPVMRRLARIADVPAFIGLHQQTLRPDLVLAFMDDIRPDEVDKISSTGAAVF